MSAQYKGLLQWVAENVYKISGVGDASQPEAEIIEIEYWLDDDHEREVAKGTGPSVWVAFIRALNEARDAQARMKAAKKPKRRARRSNESKFEEMTHTLP